MTWETLLPLIIAEGLPVAERIWQLSVNNTPPTQAEWDELKKLGEVRARERMLLALSRAGIDPDSEKGKSFLALIQ